MLLGTFWMAHIFWVVLRYCLKHSAGRHVYFADASSLLPFGSSRSQNECTLIVFNKPWRRQCYGTTFSHISISCMQSSGKKTPSIIFRKGLWCRINGCCHGNRFSQRTPCNTLKQPCCHREKVYGCLLDEESIRQIVECTCHSGGQLAHCHCRLPQRLTGEQRQHCGLPWSNRYWS